MPDGWEWDRTLFQGSAAHYERGRLPYAPGFPEALAEALGLDGRGRLLDVGCGPGTVLLPMARFFTEAVGVDPDEDMLSEAGRQAGRRGVTNARWVAARAEDLAKRDWGRSGPWCSRSPSTGRIATVSQPPCWRCWIRAARSST